MTLVYMGILSVVCSYLYINHLVLSFGHEALG